MSEAKSIIDGDVVKELLRCIAAQRWHVATGGRSERFRALLASWQIDAICRFVPLPDSDVMRMHFHGIPVSGSAYRDAGGRVDAAAVRELLDGGASLGLGGVQDYCSAVLQLSRVLEAELRCRVQVNVYQTPAGGQGLGSHIDRHDVVVLQLEGEKHWQLPAPGAAGDAAAAATSAESVSVILRAGDWLYLPLGVRHEVRNAGSTRSLHLTVGLHPLAPDPSGKPILRAHGKPVPARHLPERAALDAADCDTRFAWRAGTVSLANTSKGVELDSSYRRAPLRLCGDLAPCIERMSAVSSFRPRDLDVEDLEAATLLARFLAGAGVLSLAQS